MSKEFYKKLAEIQRTLNAPKNQYNNFGKYFYRNSEDILEAVKPLLGDFVLTQEDKIVLIGDRYYIEATATVTDGENSKSVSAYAREEESKKGMDSAQLTGATSSYARKYALNGLFSIDDAKDADTDEHSKQQGSESAQKPPQKKQKSLPTPDDILKDFTAQAADCQSVDELKTIYTAAWNALSPHPDHQQKAVDVFKTRGSELKKAE